MNRDTANFQSTPTIQSQNPSHLPATSSVERDPLSTSLPRLDEALIPPLKHVANTARDASPAASQFALPGWSQLGSNNGATIDSGDINKGSSNSDDNGASEDLPVSPGIQRGEITEISGPRGSGKTALAMATAVNAIKQGESVVWIDTAGPLCMTRFEEMLCKNTTPAQTGQLLQNLLHLQPTTLAHLLALISHPVPGFPPANTGLIVLDSISCLFGSEFRSKLPAKLSKANDLNRAEKSKDAQESKLWWKLIGNLSANLNALASRLDCAVIVTNEMVTRFRPGQKPMLHVAISGYTWDTSVATRIILYWHWLDPGARENLHMKRIRIAEVFKAGKMTIVPRDVERIVPFFVEDAGLCEFTRLSIRLGGAAGTPQPGKRKLDQQLLPSQLPRRPKIEHESEDEEGKESLEREAAEPVLATTLPAEIMDSQDEEEDEEWLEATEATDTVNLELTPDPIPGQETLEDDTELLLRSMVEGDV
ncbi:hypothetical protein McanMca71_004337 [Microsporum canis]